MCIYTCVCVYISMCVCILVTTAQWKFKKISTFHRGTIMHKDVQYIS